MRLVLFGDDYGLPRLLDLLRGEDIAALVAAAIRPAQHADLAALAAERGVPLLIQPHCEAPDYAAFAARLAGLRPDLFLVNSYSMLLRRDVLAVPRHGAVNLHGGLLPEQRGANPTEWAILRGERRTGASLHWMDDDFDTGDLISTREVPIGFTDTWLDVRSKVRAAADRLLADYLPQILGGIAPRIRQDERRAHRFRRRRAEDGRFTWKSPALDIYNLVRALVAPHPGASLEHRGGKGGAAFGSWRSLPEIVWLKSEAIGGFAEPGSRWRLIAGRPRRGWERGRINRRITLGLCGKYNRQAQATVTLTGLDDWQQANCRFALCGRPGRYPEPVLQAARYAGRQFAARELNGIAVTV